MVLQPAGAAAAVEPIPSDSKEAVHLESRAVTIEQRRSKASPKQVHKLSARKRSSSIGEGKLQKSVQSLQMGRRCSASVAGNEACFFICRWRTPLFRLLFFGFFVLLALCLVMMHAFCI